MTDRSGMFGAVTRLMMLATFLVEVECSGLQLELQ